ncbi:hypothetical protein CPB85DRAFT_1561464 [Mucidula mucida]|nr:hypothetical protein CPB85DRAFT_1561464 [Mucidula mucida]
MLPHDAQTHCMDPIWQKNETFTLPDSWIFTVDEEDDLDMDKGIETHSYAVELASKGALSKAVHEFPEFITLTYDNEIDPRPAYPEAMLSLNDLSPHHPHSIKRCLGNLFSHPCPSSFERPLIHSMTSILPGFLRFAPPPHASNWPSEIVESRMKIDGITDTHWPTLAAAIPWDVGTYDDAKLELSKIFEWSVALMIQLHKLGSPQSTSIPEWCFLLGIVYTLHGVRVYAHYPRCHETDLCAPFLQNTVRLSSLLFIVQRHTYEVETHLRELVRERGAELVRETLSSIHV